MTPRYSRRRALALGAGFVGAVLIGCTGEDGADPEAADSERAIRIRSRIPPATSGTRGSLNLGGLFAEVGPDDLDPLTRLVTYSRLVGFDPRSSMVYSDLAEEIEITGPLTVRFRLREGLFFHPDASGVAQPLTAREVMADFERRRAEGTFLFTEVVREMEAPDDTDLLLHLAAPFTLLFEFLAQEDASIRSLDTYGEIPALIGSGAFMPTARSDSEILFGPNPLLQGDAVPRLSGLRLRYFESENELDLAFGQGRLDVRVHPDDQSRQAASAVVDRVDAVRARHEMRALALSLLAPGDQASATVIEAFQDTRVRRALSLALDRKALAGIDGAVLCGPVGPAFGGDALPSVELESHPLYQHSAEGAHTLLRAAGHEGLVIRISHADRPQTLAMAQAIAEQITAGGFVARLVSRPPAEFQMAYESGDFEAAFFEVERLTTPDLGLRLHMTGGLNGTRSPWGYSNPVYDSAVREALSEIDPLLRTRRSREAQRMLLEDVPAMFPLNAPVQYASLAPGVGGYEFDGYDFNPGVLSPQWEGPPSETEG